MLIFGVAKSNFAMEWGLGVTIKRWVKEAKCQGIVGGFMVIQMEIEEFHVLSLTFLYVSILHWRNLLPLSPNRPCSPPHNHGDRERDSRLFWPQRSMKRGQSWSESSEEPRWAGLVASAVGWQWERCTAPRNHHLSHLCSCPCSGST